MDTTDGTTCIRNLDWMSEETKLEALDKLSKFTPKIGYPDKWKDYSALNIEPDDLVGNVMSDLSGRRGRVLGTEAVVGSRTLVRAEVPQMELTRYAIDLRAFSHGSATFTRSFARYDAMPSHIAAKVKEEEKEQ